MSRPGTPAFQLRRPNLPQGSAGAAGSGVGGLGGARSSTPTLGRAVLSLEEWEAKAPLTPAQTAMIKEVGQRLEQRPMPPKFTASADGNAEAGPSTPPRTRRIAQLHHSPSPGGSGSGVRSRPRTPAPSSPGLGLGLGSSQLLAPPDPLHPDLITTPQEFQEHFAALTLSTEHEQDSLYRDHLAELAGLRDVCDDLLGLLRSAEGEVGEMLRALEYVEERSESLRGACEDMLEEQTHLLTHTSQLAHRLTFFTFLEGAQKLLNTPSSTLVLADEFLPMLKRLDECIGYLEQHRDFKDAEVYLMRYQQCLTRSMTLIKIYFVNTIRTTGQDVARRIAEKTLSETAIQALIYPKFSSLATIARPLLYELESRALRTPAELGPLLGECHAAWVGARHALMSPRVAEEVRRLDPGVGDLIDLTRAGCSYLKQTAVDEFELWKMFFLSGESQMYGFLESLCDNLYDHLRPRILHEPNLEVLCGVCTVLQALMVQDVGDYPDGEGEGEGEGEGRGGGGGEYGYDDDDVEELNSSPRTMTPQWGAQHGTPDDYFGSVPMSASGSGSNSRAYGGGGSFSRSASFAQAPSPRTMRSPSDRKALVHRGSSFSLHTTGPGDSASMRTALGPRTGSGLARGRARKPLQRLHTEVLLRMVLQDAQTRLVFRAQAMLGAEVQWYSPKEGDLEYPEKLKNGSSLIPRKSKGARKNNAISLDVGGDEYGGGDGAGAGAGAIDLDEDEDDPAFLVLPPPESQEGWYPTLRVTLWILSCLWSYVDQAVFEDLAQEAISTCRRSLSAAAVVLGNKKGKEMDGRLFLVRHLLILKEMTAGLDLGQRGQGRRDWGGITNFLQSLLENAGYMLGYGTGSKSTYITDAKTDIDRELKRVCEELIQACADSACAPLREFLDRCTGYLATRSGASATPAEGERERSAADLPAQAFATPDKVREVHDAFKKSAGGAYEAWVERLSGCLMDKETVGVLQPPAQAAIVDAYRHFHDLVRAEYDFATAASIMTPSGVGAMLVRERERERERPLEI